MNFEQLITPYTSHNTLPGKNVVVLAPHPDDEVFGCGGTLHQMAKVGANITVLIITDGVLRSEQTHQNSPAARAKYQSQAKVRQNESIKAAKTLQYPPPIFLGLQDGELLKYSNLAGTLKKYLANIPYDILIAPSIWEMHRDHRAVAQAALTLIKETTHECQLAFYEVGVPLPPNYMVNISNSQTVKNLAMEHFQSQLSTQAYADQIRGLNRFRSYTLGPTTATAEAFHVIHHLQAVNFMALHTPENYTQALLKAERTIQSTKSHDQTTDSTTEQEQLETLKQTLNQTQQHLEAIQKTFSWRLTTPLRAIKRLYLKLKHKYQKSTLKI